MEVKMWPSLVFLNRFMSYMLQISVLWGVTELRSFPWSHTVKGAFWKPLEHTVPFRWLFWDLPCWVSIAFPCQRTDVACVWPDEKTPKQKPKSTSLHLTAFALQWRSGNKAPAKGIEGFDVFLNHLWFPSRRDLSQKHLQIIDFKGGTTANLKSECSLRLRWRLLKLIMNYFYPSVTRDQ